MYLIPVHVYAYVHSTDLDLDTCTHTPNINTRLKGVASETIITNKWKIVYFLASTMVSCYILTLTGKQLTFRHNSSPLALAKLIMSLYL